MARKMAGVRIREDGRLEKRFSIDGKRYSVYGFTGKEVLEREQELRDQIKAGTYTENRNITLDQYFNEWIKSREKSVKSNTINNYKNWYERIRPILGNKKIQKLERREIKTFQDVCSQELKPCSVNNIMHLLKMMLNDAVRDEIIMKSPANGIKEAKETEKASETYHRALTEQEQADFMQEAKESFYYNLFALLLCTGMRNGEARALTWQDVDLKNNVIHINKTVTCDKDGHLTTGTPKTAAGKRDIPLTDTARGVLVKQREMMNNILSFDRQERVFSSVDGSIVYNPALNKEIALILKRLAARGIAIEHFTTHAFRDTFATRFIEQGGQPQTLKTILGHSSLAMTMDLYAHVLPNTKQEEMSRINIAI